MKSFHSSVQQWWGIDLVHAAVDLAPPFAWQRAGSVREMNHTLTLKTKSVGYGAAVVLVCAISLLAQTGCEQGPKTASQEKVSEPMKSIDEVIRVHADSLLAIPGVVGVYHGQKEDGTACLKVMVKERSPEIEKRIPGTLDGYSVVIEETGEIRPMK